MATATTRQTGRKPRYAKPLWTTEQIHKDCRILAAESGSTITSLTTKLLSQAIEHEKQRRAREMPAL